MNEQEIIAGCLRYDRQAQRLLYEKYSGLLWGICIRYTKNIAEARDIFFRCLHHIFQEMRQYVYEKKRKEKAGIEFLLEEWLRHHAIAEILAYLLQNKKEYSVSSTVNMREGTKIAPPVLSEKEILQYIDKKLLIHALQQLTPFQRVLYNLHEIDGYSEQDIGQLLNISTAAIRDGLEKARFNIRRHLTQLLLSKK